MASTQRRQESRDAYSIGWIVALSIELASAKAMLDEVHQEPADFQRSNTDQNSYTYGRIGMNNVVIASLSSGVNGNTMATSTALGMLASFSNIKFGLLVGIGAGVPGVNDIRLGDIAVSQPSGTSGGVFQYDFGKAISDGEWNRTDHLARIPEVLLKALSSLQGDHELEEPRLHDYLQQASTTHQKWGKNYGYPEGALDLLFEATYNHSVEKPNCLGCDRSNLILRPQRDSNGPEIHYGAIASGNTLVKDGIVRNKIASMESSCICIEMEAAGLMNNFPCIVIRGICDYADSHKNDAWQRYASATAAAFAKELLSYVQPREVDATTKAKNLVENTNEALVEIKKQWEQTNRDKAEEKRGAFLKSLAEAAGDYGAGKNYVEKRAEATCGWFTSHQAFRSWQEGVESGVLWLTADPASGKSVLSRYLIEEVLPASKPSATICYFFFGTEAYDPSPSKSLCALLHQLFKNKMSALNEEILNDFHSQGSNFTQSFPILWNTLLSATSKSTDGEIICVLDSLDDCQDRRELLQKLSQFGLQSGHSSNLKFIVTSRPSRTISTAFQEFEQKFPNMHLRGDGDEESVEIAKEVDFVVKCRVKTINETKGLHETDEELLYSSLLATPNWSYAWSRSVLDIIEESFDVNTESIQQTLSYLPLRLDELYEHMIDQTPDRSLATKLFQIILASRRPLSVREISIFLNISAAHRSYGDLARFLQSEGREDRMRTNIRELSGLLIRIIDSKVYLIHPTVKEFLLQSDLRGTRPSSEKRFSKLASFDKYIEKTTNSFASSLSRTNSLLPTLPSRASSYFSIPVTDESQSSRLAKQQITRTNSSEQQSFLPRKTSMSSTTSPPLRSPSTFSGHDSSTTLGIHGDDNSAGWRIYVDLPSAHAVLAEMCAFWLDMSSDDDQFPDIDRYCKTTLFWHLYMADSQPRVDQNRNVTNLLDSKLRPYWNLILRHMPNYEKDSIDYCPPPDDTLLNLLIYLGICPLVSTELARSASDTSTERGIWPQLCIAAARGDKKMLNLLFDHYNINLKMKDDITPLHAAAQCGKLEAVKLLVERNANIEAKMRDGSRPLNVAVKHGRIAIVSYLLDRGAEIEIRPSDQGLTVLNQAISNGDAEMVKLLLDKGANFTAAQNNQILPFHRAASGEKTEVLHVLRERGADVEVKDVQGSRALHFAAINGRIANIEYLLENFADIDAANGNALTPVTYAIKGNKPETLKALIDRSARCSILDFLFAFQPMITREAAWLPKTEWNGSVNHEIMSTLLDVVGSLPENDMQRFLCHERVILDTTSISKILEAGAKASIAALIAALRRDVEYKRWGKWANTGDGVVELILEKLDIQIVGASDRRRLTLVALQDQSPARVLQLLYHKLILVGELDKQERRKPFLFSAIEGNLHFVKASLEALVAVDEQDDNGRTALSYAFAFGMISKDDVKPALSDEQKQQYLAIADLLLQRGANEDRPDKAGITPLQWAETAGNSSAEELVASYRLEMSPSMDIPDSEHTDEEELSATSSALAQSKSPMMKTTKEMSSKTVNQMNKMSKEVGKDIGKMSKGMGRMLVSSSSKSKELGKDLSSKMFGNFKKDRHK